MTNGEKKEIIINGLILGMILFLSTLFILLINIYIENFQVIWTFLIPIFVGYCLLGMFIRWMAYRSTLRKNGFSILSGTDIAHWILFFSTIFMVGAFSLPHFIRYVVVTNVLTLLLIWFLNCIYIKKISNELNTNMDYYRKAIVIDLSKKPETEEIFTKEIVNYCKKNHLSLEIIEYGIPSKIKLDNILYLVQLGQHFSVEGCIIYTLEFHNIVSKTLDK